MKLRLSPISAAILAVLFPGLLPATEHDAIELISPDGETVVLQPGDRVIHPGAGIAVNVKGPNNALSGAGVSIVAGTAGDPQPSRAVNVEEGGSVVLTDGSTIDIQGDEAVGVHVGSGGDFRLQDGSVTTRGRRADGLSATGVGSRITIRGGAISADGTMASGVRAERGAEIVLEGTQVTSTALASESAAGLFVDWEGRVLATDTRIVAGNGKGVVVEGGHLSFTGGSIEAARQAIRFSAPSHPSHVVPPPSTAEIRDARIHSRNGIAIDVNSGASRVSLDNVAISTDGPASPAIWITDEAASVTARNGTRIASTGNYGSGVDIRAGRFKMETGSITTHGNNARGLLMVEIYAGSGGSATSTLRDVAIETFGSNSHGAWTRKAGFDAFLHGGMITTHGDSAHGLAASGGGTITSDLTRVQTEADNAYGLYAFSTGRIQADGLQVNTRGQAALGVIASNDGSRISLRGGTVTTEGDDARGLSAINGGRIEADDVQIVAGGHAAHGAYLRGDGSELLLRGVDLSAQGLGGDALRMDAWDGPVHARVVDSSIHSLQGNGIALYDGARLEVERSRIRNEHNYRSGVFIQGDGNRISLLDTVIESDGIQGIGLWNAGADSEVVITGGAITTRGDFGYGVLTQVSRPGASARVSLRDVAIETFGNTAFGMLATDSQVSVEGGSITTHGDGAGGIIAERLTSPLSLVGTTIDTYGGCTGFYCADALLFAGEALLEGARLYAHGTGTRGIWSYRTDGGDNRLSLTGGARVETANGTALLVTGSGLTADLSDATVIGRSANGNGLLLRVEALDNKVIAPSVIEAGHVQLNARRSWLEGDVWLDSGSADLDLRDHSTLTGTLWDNAGRHVGRLALDDGSRWNLRGPSTLGQLHTTGTVSFTGPGFTTLDIVGNLDGAGLFEMRTDLAAGRGDLLRVGGTVSGDHRVLVANSGAEPDSEGGFLEIIRTEGGDGTFQLANIGQAVDVGTYRYTLHTSDRVGGRNSDWSLINTGRLDPPKPPEPPVEPPVTPPEPPVEPPVTPPEPPVEPPVTPPEPPVEPPVTPPEPPVEPPVTPPEPPVIRPPNPDNLSTTANAAIDTSAASTLQAIWHSEAGSLVKRVGERRAQPERGGAWVRGWAEDQQLDNRGGRPFDQTVRGVQAGSDRAFAVDGGRWHLGGVAGYSQTERRFGGEGTGRTRSVHLGGYATFLADDGWYFDALVKNNRFDSRFNVVATDGRSVRGHTRQNGIGLAMETGRQWRFGDGWFLEPQAGMTLLHINGDAYRTSNGMRVKADGGNSLQLRTSALLGRHIPLADGGFVQPYFKLGEVREFDGRGTVRTNGIATRTDLSGSRTEYGLGVTGSVNGRHHLYADVERADGQRIDKPWSVNVGYRLSW